MKPGEKWHVERDEEEDPRYRNLIMDQNEIVSATHREDYARLIAALPDLVEALRHISDCDRDMCELCPCVYNCHADTASEVLRKAGM